MGDVANVLLQELGKAAGLKGQGDTQGLITPLPFPSRRSSNLEILLADAMRLLEWVSQTSRKQIKQTLPCKQAAFENPC